MKNFMVSTSLLLSFLATAESLEPVKEYSVMCRDDQRMKNGSLSEITLVSSDGGYEVVSTFIASKTATEVKTEIWASGLSCRIDKPSLVSFCQNDQAIFMITETKTSSYDSLDPASKKKTVKEVTFSMIKDGVAEKSMSFDSSKCDIESL
jgi:hypothetical protein